MRKQLGRTEEAIAREAEDAVVEIDLDNVMTLSTDPDADIPAAAKGKNSKDKGKKKVTISEQAKVDSAFRNSDDEGDDVEERAQKKGKAFKQRDLVALAFAGDNVVEVSVQLGPCFTSVLTTSPSTFSHLSFLILIGVQRSEAA